MSTTPFDDTILVAYVDGELEPDLERRVEQAMIDDESVRGRIAMFRNADQLLRSAMSESRYRDVPEHLQNLVTQARLQPWRRRTMRLLLPIAAAIVAFILGSMDIPSRLRDAARHDAREVMKTLDEVAEYHAAFARRTAHLIEVPATQVADIESWLGDRVQLAFRVPDLKSRQLDFQGGRVLVLNGQPVAQLIYTDPGGAKIALCITLEANDADTPIQESEQNGLKLFGKAKGRHVFIVVGPSGNGALKSIIGELPGLLVRT